MLLWVWRLSVGLWPTARELQTHQVAAAAVEMAVSFPATRQSKQEVLCLSFL